MRSLLSVYFFVLILITGCSSPLDIPDEDPPSTIVSFALQESSQVVIWLENAYKTKVLTITDQVYPAGNHSVAFEFADGKGKTLPVGIYTIVIEAGQFSTRQPIFFN